MRFALLLPFCSTPQPPAPAKFADQPTETKSTGPARPSEFLDTEVLKSLPHIHTVEVSPASKEPKRQILHILDWHYLPKDEFAADIRTEAREALSDEEFEQAWESFQKAVEAVQAEQMALLNELLKSHGRKPTPASTAARFHKRALASPFQLDQMDHGDLRRKAL